MIRRAGSEPRPERRCGHPKSRLAAASGHPRKLMVPVPAAPLGLVARLLERLPAFPVTADQLQMLLEGNTFETGGDVVRGRSRFDVTNLAYLASAA